MYKHRVPSKIKGYLQSSDIDTKVSPNSSVITSPLHDKSRGKMSGPYYIDLKSKDKSISSASLDKDLSFSTQEKSLPNINISKINSSITPHLSPIHFNSSQRITLPDINTGSNIDLALSYFIQTEDTLPRSPMLDDIPVFRNMNDSDFVKQDEIISKSPHFAKFSKLTSLLDKMDSRKSSLTKEMFYYPDQVEMNQSLVQHSAHVQQTNEDAELGITSIFFHI